MKIQVAELMAKWNQDIAKIKFLSWCDDVMRREDLDAYIDQIQEGEKFYGITDADRQEYREIKQRELESCPF